MAHVKKTLSFEPQFLKRALNRSKVKGHTTFVGYICDLVRRDLESDKQIVVPKVNKNAEDFYREEQMNKVAAEFPLAVDEHLRQQEIDELNAAI